MTLKRGGRVGRRMIAMKRILPLCLLLASTTVFAQEFGRASGGDISMITKGPTVFSGSLGASFGVGGGRSYMGSAGGAIVKDKMWFFGSAEVLQPQRISSVFAPQLSLGQAVGGSVNSQIGDRNSLGASFRSAQPSFNAGLPSNFLSLRYTGMLSPSSFVTVSASSTKQ